MSSFKHTGRRSIVRQVYNVHARVAKRAVALAAADLTSGYGVVIVPAAVRHGRVVALLALDLDPLLLASPQQAHLLTQLLGRKIVRIALFEWYG